MSETSSSTMISIVKTVKTVSVLVVLLFIAWPENARCEDEGIEEMNYILLLGDFPVLAVGIGASIANIASITKGSKGHLGWQITGYLSGAANIGAGIAWLSLHEGREEHLLIVSIAHIIIGSLDIGLTIWSSMLPEEEGIEIKIGPVLQRDCTGRMTMGVGISLLSW